MARRRETAEGITQPERVQLDIWRGTAGSKMDRSGNVFDDEIPYRADISGAVSIDLAAGASAGARNLELTLTGNVSSFALANPGDGRTYNFWLYQDATGGRTFAGFPAIFDFGNGTAPTLTTTANAYDFFSCIYSSVKAKFTAVHVPNPS